MNYVPNKRAANDMGGTIISIARLNASVANMMRCLMENEKLEAHLWKEYGDTYA